MPVTVPNIGSRVRVTTIYPNSYAYRGEFGNYVTTIREGLVVKSAFTDLFMFAVETGNIDHPVSEFNSKSQHVVKIEYILDSSSQIQTSNKAWKVSSQDGKKFYLVQRVNANYSCTCKGFKSRHDCKHIAAAAKKGN